MEKEKLVIIEEDKFKPVIKKVNLNEVEKRKIIHVIPEIMNFIDFSTIFGDDGDWYGELIVWEGKNNGFSSTFDIARFLQENGVIIDYPPELVNKNSIMELIVSFQNNVDEIIDIEFSTPKNYYHESIMIISYGRLGKNEEKSIIEGIRNSFEKIYKNKEINSMFKVVEEADYDDKEKNLIKKINKELEKIWKENRG